MYCPSAHYTEFYDYEYTGIAACCVAPHRDVQYDFLIVLIFNIN